MKKMLAIVLTLTALVLCGCVEEPIGETTTGPQSQLQTPPTTEPDPTETTLGITVVPPTRPRPADVIPTENTGAVRISYTIPISSVRYVTAVSQLPDNEAFAAYDETYFETGALLLVTETVSSATVQVGIETVQLAEGIATVRLLHEQLGDVGVPTMTTWLLWAEVEPGLELQWVVENPAVDSEINRE